VVTHKSARRRRLGCRIVAAIGAITAGVLGLTGPVAAASPAAGPESRPGGPAPGQVAPQAPDPLGRQLAAQLGKNWYRSKDMIFTSIGDAKGMHYFVAREAQGFYWQPLASIMPGGIDASSWSGFSCLTGDNRYILATVYPTQATNVPALEDRGAFAYVITVATGKVRPLIGGVAMYYDTPGCGTGDTAVLSAFPGSNETSTELVTANLATDRIVRKQLLAGQFTSAVPAPGGIDAFGHGAIVSINPAARIRRLAGVHGVAYNLRVGRAGLDYLTTSFGATAQGWALAARASAKPVRIASGARTSLQLFTGADGKTVVTGAAPASAPMRTAMSRAGVGSVAVPGRPAAVSQGTGVAETLATGTGKNRLAVIPQIFSPLTGRTVSRPLPAAANSVISLPAAAVFPTARTRATAAKQAGVTPQDDLTTPVCAVPRLNPQLQVMQPDHEQVEWAVDLAVQDQLTVTRPANYDNMGLPAYSPDSDIPAPALTGGGTIPPQVEMGILAQESNFDEASWHALPGYPGDPLVANYYGAGTGIDTIDYSDADCGYGIGQITNGMTTGSTYWGSGTAIPDKIAVDYTENIAASVSLLAQKWNQLYGYSPRMTANGGNPKYVENWYMAIWAYNSGLNPQSSTGNTTGCTPGPNCTDAAGNGPGGNWGLGWTNNPEDPDWLPSREPFLKTTYADAATPEYWPYQEKVLGWAAIPLLDYTGAASYVPVSQYPDIAPFPTFCTSADHCTTSSGCSLSNFHCWWNGPVSWVSCSSTSLCTPGIAAYQAGSGEPANPNPHPPMCNSTLPSTAYIVDEIPVDYNLVGCTSNNWTSTGSFTLTEGQNSSGQPIAVIDTHQVGAGFGGHIWFTHNVAASDTEHIVTGTWTASLPTHAYAVYVSVPSTGGTTTSATYHITASNGTVYSDTVDQYQQQNEWIGIGYYTLGSNAKVTLNNVTGDGALEAHDVAYDAVAFVPVPGTAVDKTFDAVSLFDWNTNLNTNIPSQVDTPARTMLTLQQWALDYSNEDPLWSNPSDYVYGVMSFPECSGTYTAACIPPDVWTAADEWYTDATQAGSAPSTSKTPVMTEPTWLSFNNPTPPPATMTSSTFSSDTSYKIKTHIDVSYVVSNGTISPGSDMVNTSVRTGTTTIPQWVRDFISGVDADYGITGPNLNYSELDANTYSGESSSENTTSTGKAPGMEYVWHSDPAAVNSGNTCVIAHTEMGGSIGYRAMAASGAPAASISAWITALQNDPSVNNAVIAMATQINQFFFSTADLGGTPFAEAPPIWQNVHIQVCTNGKVSSAEDQIDIDDNPEVTLVDQSYMPDLYLYFNDKLVNQSGASTTTRVQTGNFANFSNIPLVDTGPNAYGLCDSGNAGNAGNPWNIGTVDSLLNAGEEPATGDMCDDQPELFGSPYPGG
jgi:hypothetical protein